MEENQNQAQAFALLESGLQAKIKKQQGRLAKLRDQLEKISRDERECVQEIAEMENAIAVFESAFGLGSGVRSRNGVDTHRYLNQTVGQSAYDIMEMNHGSARIVKILRILMDAGKLKRYDSGYSTIKKTLDRDQRFEKVKPGEYAITNT